MQYSFHFVKMVGCNTFIMLNLSSFFVNLIPNLDLALQKVPPPTQDEHGDAMEENEWVQQGVAR
jgi:hypothetical protein